MSAVDNYLEVLKGLVLMRNAVNTMVPQLAKPIAYAVFLQTHHELSEVAVLRLFNYLPSKFAPSSFTKDVLAMYCGYENYLDFCEKRGQDNILKDGDFDLPSPLI